MLSGGSLMSAVVELRPEIDERRFRQSVDRAIDGAERQMVDGIGDAGERAGDRAGDGIESGLKEGAARGGQAVERELGTSSARMKKTFGNMQKWGAGMTAGVTLPLVMLGKRAVSSAADLAETQTKVEAIFGPDAAASLNEFAAGAATAIGQSQKAALDAASTFGVFGKAAGLTGQDLVTFSQDLTVLSSDLASFWNATPEDAAQALGAALRGESEPIRRFGVMLNEEALQAEALSMGLVKAAGDTTKIAQAQLTAQRAARAYAESVKANGEESADAQEKLKAMEIAQAKLKTATEGTVPKLTQQQKALAAASAITKQTADAQGDFAKTSDGLANQQRILAAEVENAASEVGEELLPVMKDVLTIVRDLLGWFRGLPEGTKQFVVLGGVIAALVGPMLTVIGTIGKVGMALGGLIGRWVGVTAAANTAAGAQARAAAAGGGGALGALGKVAVGAGALYAGLQVGAWIGDGIDWGREKLGKEDRNTGGQIRDFYGNLGLPMMADGGTVTRGGAAIVGEDGIEMVNLPRGAQVTPLDGRAGVGVTITGPITVVANDPGEMARQLDRVARRAAGTTRLRRAR